MRVFLCGPIARPELVGALGLNGSRAVLPLTLAGGDAAGLGRDGWPVAVPGGTTPAIGVLQTPELMRYLAVMGLQPMRLPQGEVYGARIAQPGEDLPQPWDEVQWAARHGALAAAIAQGILASEQPAEQLAARVGMVAARAAARLRAAQEGVEMPELPPVGAESLRDLRLREPYARFFAVEEMTFSHVTHDGGWTPDVLRAVFVMGDAVVVLPWDPLRDRVLVIDQFRPGPLARGDSQCFMLETIAGRVDAGETPSDAARREAQEEAGLVLDQLIAAPAGYPSPGAVSEYLYHYVGLADLPDGSAGIGGVEDEHEDIRAHLMSRARLVELVLAGKVANGPLAFLALWLDRMADQIRAGLTGG